MHYEKCRHGHGVEIRDILAGQAEHRRIAIVSLPVRAFGVAPLAQGRIHDLVAGSKEGTEERAALDSITSAARSLWSRSRWR